MNDSEILAGEHVKKKPWSLRRKPFPWPIYLVTYFFVVTYAVLILQWSLYSEDSFSQALSFMTKMWGENPAFQFINNFFVWSLVFFVCTFLINRFWISTPIFILLITLIAIAERMKVMTRNDVIIPSDLLFLNGNTGEIASFIPPFAPILVWKILGLIIGTIAISWIFFVIDGRKKVISFKQKPTQIIVRVILIALPLTGLYLYSHSIADTNSLAFRLSKVFSNNRIPWSTYDDSRANGTALAFLHLLNPKVMDIPAGYNEKNMADIAKRYEIEAETINKSRTNKLTDNTVIYILSESFSDPSRVPGITLNKDPMPRIRQLKSETTSGLMLSSGYGGGTANIEYEALTGLSMANFDPSLTTPYQQLVPKQEKPYSFNQLWNVTEGEPGSEALHTYTPNMYFRESNFKKFGFSQFWNNVGPDKLKYQDSIPNSPYTSDESAYKNLIAELNKKSAKGFFHLVTMQNHMPYQNWYEGNDFQARDISKPLTADEAKQINTFSKGINYTDTATYDFLNQLNTIEKPITVIFYGDHLPGIYNTDDNSSDELLALHKTDFFIWSNSGSASNKLENSNHNIITSPNYFSALVASHINSKISPYLAFLTNMHNSIPALEPITQSENSSHVYLAKDGTIIESKNLSDEQSHLLHEYHLIQYDMTVGNHYLEKTGFTKLPIK